MGGLGSGKSYGRGRKKRGKKLFTTDLPRLHIPSLMRLHGDGGSGRYVWMDAHHLTVEGGEVCFISGVLEGVAAKIEQIPCHYGGFRYSVHCPRCDKRVKGLYLLLEKHLGCRHCFRMCYHSQNARKSTNLNRKRWRVEALINGDPWAKPKWMRWPTFERLKKEYWDLEEQADVAEFMSLRNNRQVATVLQRYGCSESAGIAYLASYGIST
ncbi:MAG: hypothetical protein ACE5GN_03100 [Waddliaceae bacterium]